MTVATALQQRLGCAPPAAVLATALREVFPGRIAVVSSFGAESAVLLHLVAAIDRATPVLFIDTGRHFAETLEYRDRLRAYLGLTDVRNIGPTAEEVARLDADASRAIWDPDGCCAFRKIAPLQRALAGFDAWITGRKRYQGGLRERLPAIERSAGRIKLNPLAAWSRDQIEAELAARDLPRHPLVEDGFLSIGCMPCTDRVAPGADERSGRWAGTGKTECGIHLPWPEVVPAG